MPGKYQSLLDYRGPETETEEAAGLVDLSVAEQIANLPSVKRKKTNA